MPIHRLQRMITRSIKPICRSCSRCKSDVSSLADRAAKATAVPLVRGMHDVFTEEARLRRHVHEEFFRIAGLFGFGEIQTPLLESTKLFARSLGDASDVVMKEMYTFNAPNSDESLTLRPENTAGVIRALLSSNQITQSHKLCYAGPMFRHERPQRGRYRQFHQVGVEHVGSSGALADVEILHCAHAFLHQFIDLSQLDLSLVINSLGDTNTMHAYSQALRAYLQQHATTLSSDSQKRLERGAVLRILDSKDKTDQMVLTDAPKISAFYSSNAGQRFERVLQGLHTLGIPYEVNTSLVRGLDYYRHTIFEFIAQPISSSTNASSSSPPSSPSSTANPSSTHVGTVLAGGRYDDLPLALGGPPNISAVGWAAGVERLLLLSKPMILQPVMQVCVIPFVSKDAAAATVNTVEDTALSVAATLRSANRRCLLYDAVSNIRKALSKADKQQARYAVVVGEDEVVRGVVTLRDMQAATQQQVPHTDLLSHIATTS